MFSSRLARSALSPLARRACTQSPNAARVVKRNMSSSSHGHGSQKQSSDMPWIIGSAVFFTPILLYILSPSARKASQQAHHEKHDKQLAPSKGDHEEETPAKEIMKDDEGKEADVSASVALAEASDVPKDSQSPEKTAEIQKEAESSSPEAAEPTQPKLDVKEAASSSESEKGNKAGTFQKEGDEGPTNMGTARSAAREGTTPKEQTEKH